MSFPVGFPLHPGRGGGVVCCLETNPCLLGGAWCLKAKPKHINFETYPELAALWLGP